MILVDIAPWKEYTSSKLFTYEELVEANEVRLRVVETPDQIRQEDYSCYNSEVTDFPALMEQMC
jgi:hypothetical protein